MLDQIAEGQFYTADFLRSAGLIKSPSFGTLFKLLEIDNKNQHDADVYNLGVSDNSAVFQVRNMFYQNKITSQEFNASQTNTVIIPAPGIGKRIVIDYISVRTESSNGDCFFIGGLSGIQILKMYFSIQQQFTAANVNLSMLENAPLLFNSTQGAKRIFAAVEYYIETIKAALT